MHDRIFLAVLALATTAILVLCAELAEAQVVTDGLVCYWSFDKDTVQGDTVKDVWGEGHGEIKGDLKVVPGKVGEGLEFSEGNYIFVPTTEGWELVDEITVETWIFPTLIAGDERTIFIVNDQANNWPYRLELNRDSNIKGNPRISGANNTKYQVNTETEIPLDKWSHIVGRHSQSESELSVFLNGKKEATASVPVALSPTSQNATIGCYASGGSFPPAAPVDFFVGIIDELRMYNRALSEDEIKQNYAAKGLAVNSVGNSCLTWGEIKTTGF